MATSAEKFTSMGLIAGVHTLEMTAQGRGAQLWMCLTSS